MQRLLISGLMFASMAFGFLGGTLVTRLFIKAPIPPHANLRVEDPYWRHAKAEIYRSARELLIQQQNELEQGHKYRKLIHGNSGLKEIALTFDDGPHPHFTPRLLALLRKEHVPATFFLVGKMAEKYPALVRQELADGHSVGNHTYHHVNLTEIPVELVATEIKACGQAMRAITGKAPHLFRPPGGNYDHLVAMTADMLGYTMVLWTDDPGDFKKPGIAVVRRRLLAHAANGGILLVHDGIEQTLQVLPDVITTLRKRGYTFVTIDEMLAHRATRSPTPLARRGRAILSKGRLATRARLD